MMRFAVDTISEASTEYRANDFFVNKQNISESMFRSLNNRLKRDINIEIVFF